MQISRSALLRVASITLLIAQASVAQSVSTASDLFRKLGNAATSDEAADQLIDLAKSDSNARSYVAVNISALIARNPRENPEQWGNAVRIAGELKITQSCRALKQWVGDPGLGLNEFTLSEIARLLGDPPAHALVQIGEPAIPTLEELLDSNNLRARSDAVQALQLIGSPAAIEALRQHEPHETNPKIKSFIADILARKDIKK